MRITKSLAAFAAASAALTGTALANVIVLDFEGIAPSYPFSNNSNFVQEFYNGGTSSAGTSGEDFGIAFSENALAICLNTPGTSCSNTSHGGQNPDSSLSALFFLSGTSAVMNVAEGFEEGFSFQYTAPNNAGFVEIWSGLDGTGEMLASFDLTQTSSNCGPEFSAGFCPFTDIGVTFEGMAMSVLFGGVANQVVFDDITFGSAIVGGEVIPIPGAAVLFGTALAGGAFARRRRKPLG